MIIYNFRIIKKKMDIFQMIGDFLHLLAMLMLVLKILANKNVIGTIYQSSNLGLSYKTQ